MTCKFVTFILELRKILNVKSIYKGNSYSTCNQGNLLLNQQTAGTADEGTGYSHPELLTCIYKARNSTIDIFT